MNIIARGKVNEIDAFMSEIHTLITKYKCEETMRIILGNEFDPKTSIVGNEQTIRRYYHLEEIIKKAEEIQRLSKPIKEYLSRYNIDNCTVEITSQSVHIIKDESTPKRNDSSRKE